MKYTEQEDINHLLFMYHLPSLIIRSTTFWTDERERMKERPGERVLI